MKIAWVLLVGGCTLNAVAQSPDANGLGVQPTDLGARRDLAGVAPDDLAMPGSMSSDGAVAPPDLSKPDLAPARPSPIALENAKPGDPGWKLTAPSGGVEGFAGQQSYLPGDTVQIHASATAAITWELWRLGYYGGAGGRKITSGGPVVCTAGAAATMDSSTGMVRAPWPATFNIKLDDDLTTGFYVVKLIAPASQSYVPFIVRASQGKAPILWPVAFNTYQAYNAWGGTGLYNNTRSDWPQWHAYAVSFDRPFLQGDGAGQLFFADRDFITFAEGQGYDLDYVTDSDVDGDASLTMDRSLIVLQGHSEYWSGPERAHLESAIAAGTNLVVFGANDLFWQVRYDAAHRVMTGYKEFADKDPIADPSLKTTQWRSLGKPENAVLGVMFGEWIWSSVPLRVSHPGSWIWANAGVDDGSMIAGLYGFEIDRRYDNGAEPAGLSEIGSGLGENHSAELAAGQATLYTAPSGASVFASGTVSWSQALAADGMWDPRVQQATHNLFARFAGVAIVGDAPRKLTLGPGQPEPDYQPNVQVSTVTTDLKQPVAVAAAPDGSIIVADGDDVVRVKSGAVTLIASGFKGPRGLAVAPDGTIYVADTGRHLIEKIVGTTVSGVAGSSEGFADGKPGKFDQPMSIALLPSGTLLVADVWNQRVRAVAPDGTVSTWAGNGSEAVTDGVGSAAAFWFPFALTTFADGTAVVAESNDGLLRKIAPNQSVGTYAGELGRVGWWDGATSVAAVSEVQGLAARADGALAILDAATYRIRILQNGTVKTLAGGATSALVDGAGADAGFFLPRAATFAADGSLYVADTGNHALRRITF